MTRDELLKALTVERFAPRTVDRAVGRRGKSGGKPVDRYVKPGGAFDDSDVNTARRRRELAEATGRDKDRSVA